MRDIAFALREWIAFARIKLAVGILTYCPSHDAPGQDSGAAPCKA